MAIRLRGRANRRINENLPIHTLHSSLIQQDNEINPYPFNHKISKLTDYPEYIDIVHLLHDIYTLNSSNINDQYLLEKIQIEIGNFKSISFVPQLAEFVKFAVNKIVKTYYYGSYNSNNNNGPNWMLLLFHENNNNNVLSIISTILSLFDVNIYYNKYKCNDYMISLISSLCIIRNNIPYSLLKGIDNQLQLNEKDNSKYYINYKHLFGEKLVKYLLLDLCKYILTFLDIQSFFLCSLINNCWLHFVYRNDTFLSIYKQIISENKHIKCQLFDHSILSQVHIPNTPITVGWTLQTHNNSYLDFVTLKNHFFQQYINIIDITLQKKEFIQNIKSETETLNSETETLKIETENACKWIDIKYETKSTNEIGFDSIVFKRGVPFDIGQYRIKLNILTPFKSQTIHSNIVELDPIKWTYYYNESKARDDDYEKLNTGTNDRKLFHVHKFWFEFYVDLLQSLNTNVISDVLKNLRICQNRIKMDNKYLQSQYNDNLFKTIIRYVSHENNKIKLNAMRCLRRIAIQDSKDMQYYYLNALSKHGLIKICIHMLYKSYNIDNNTIGNIREQMLWFLGYFIKTGVQWKSIFIKEINIQKFIKFLIQEIKINRRPKYTASYIWTLSKFFSLYNQTRMDDLSCDNSIILDTNLGKICVELMFNSFKISFSKYKKLKLSESADKREQQMMQMTDNNMNNNSNEERKEKEVERQKQMDGLYSVVRDSYYAYSMILRYFTKEILDIIDMKMLFNIISDFDLVIDGMDYEFGLRMVRTSLSYCIDTILRLKKCNQEIFKYGYLDKLCVILDAMIAKLKFLINIKEKNINIFNEHDKPKQDLFMMLFVPILEAIPIIGCNIHILHNAKPQLMKLLYLIVDIAVLHNDYLNVCDFKNENKEQISERKSSLQDQVCCTMSVIWDVLSKYGHEIRQYINCNDKIMYLIESKWVVNDNMVTRNQAQSLLAVLKNDDAYNALFGNKCGSNGKNNDDIVYCPCGDVLRLIEAKDCYPPSTYSYLYCDYCREKIDWGLNPNRMVYHCDKKEKAHPHGFDLCVFCAKRKLIIDITQ